MEKSVKLVGLTKPTDDISVEAFVAYVARVSNPANQNNTDTSEKLLKYLAKNKHWSPFEMVHIVLEINTTRDIARQILRHRSFSFQEFSQRYADTNLLGNIPVPDLRKQDIKNRQNSTDDLGDYLKLTLQERIRIHFEHSVRLYNELLGHDVAKESARFVLPLATPTRIYMTGSVRSWVTYISLREKNGTQKEHMDIAKECKIIFNECFPVTSSALGGVEGEWVI